MTGRSIVSCAGTIGGRGCTKMFPSGHGLVLYVPHTMSGRVRLPLTPVPVSGAFDHVGVDVLQLPRTRKGNRYAVLFVDYLTKWPEVFAVPNQMSATIAQLLVEEVVSRHGVLSEVLSDHGQAFLSGLMRDVQMLLGYQKVNTTVYQSPD